MQIGSCSQADPMGHGKLSAVNVYSGSVRLAVKLAYAIGVVMKNGLEP